MLIKYGLVILGILAVFSLCNYVCAQSQSDDSVEQAFSLTNDQIEKLFECNGSFEIRGDQIEEKLLASNDSQLRSDPNQFEDYRYDLNVLVKANGAEQKYSEYGATKLSEEILINCMKNEMKSLPILQKKDGEDIITLRIQLSVPCGQCYFKWASLRDEGSCTESRLNYAKKDVRKLDFLLKVTRYPFWNDHEMSSS